MRLGICLMLVLSLTACAAKQGPRGQDRIKVSVSVGRGGDKFTGIETCYLTRTRSDTESNDAWSRNLGFETLCHDSTSHTLSYSSHYKIGMYEAIGVNVKYSACGYRATTEGTDGRWMIGEEIGKTFNPEAALHREKQAVLSVFPRISTLLPLINLAPYWYRDSHEELQVRMGEQGASIAKFSAEEVKRFIRECVPGDDLPRVWQATD